MFSDPQTVTVDSVAQTLAAISRERFKSIYREDNGEYEMEITHQEGAQRNRRMVRLNRTITTADPFVPAQNVERSLSVYLVIDAPIAGFDNEDIKLDALGLTGWCTGANLLKVLGGES